MGKSKTNLEKIFFMRRSLARKTFPNKTLKSCFCGILNYLTKAEQKLGVGLSFG